MSCQKRKADKEEKDKTSAASAKRACLQDDSSPSKKGHSQLAGKNIRMYSEEERQRVLAILEREFDNELQAKEDEIVEIQERIIKTQRILQYLCYAVVSDFYSKEKTITSVASTRQRRIHPAVKKLLSGKGPPGAPDIPQNVTIPAEDPLLMNSSWGSSRYVEAKDNDILSRSESPNSSEGLSEKEKKVPRYIPPKQKPKSIVGSQSDPVRGGQNKIKTILVVGNVSKWLPPDSRDDAASHKWMVYVRGPKGSPDISSFVSKVRFFLHPSYRPNDVVQVVCPPFQLSRRGWGEFPIRVQVHFSNCLNKPVDIIHNLKLDRTYSGLQALGAETVAEVWIHRAEKSLEENSKDELQITIKHETVENIQGTSLEASKASNTTAACRANLKAENAENHNQDKKNLTLLQPTEMKSCQQHKQDLSNSLTVKNIIASEGTTDKSLKSDTPVTKIKTECLENECIIAQGLTGSLSLTASDTKQGKPVGAASNMLPSPTKSVLPDTVPSIPPQNNPSVQQSPSKLLPGSQKVQCSPSKPGTQIVKCVDSKGTVRLLQVRSDLLPKILKKGTATIPATPPVLLDERAKPTLEASVKQLAAQPATTQASSLNSVARVSTQTQVTPVQVPVTQVPSVPPVVKESPQLITAQGLTQTSLPSPATCKVALTSPVKVQGVQGMQLSPGGRPVIRLVRPPGNANTRPLLVASNPASQQFIRLPAAAAANGNQPLLVLKDGKLFMMKSVLGSAATANVATSAPTASVVSTNPTSKSQLSQESASNVASAILRNSDSLTTSIVSSTANQHIMTKVSLSLDVNKSLDSKLNDRVSGSVLKDQPSAAANVGTILKPRSSIAIPPAARLSSPNTALGGDQMLQSTNKSNSLLAQRLLPPQSIMNTAGTPKVVAKAGKSLLKPAVSLLKANVNAPMSSCKLSSVPTPSLKSSLILKPPPGTAPLSTESMPSKRIILGRTSGSSSVTATSQQALAYREILKQTVRMCPKVAQEDVWRAVRWMITKLPLVHSEAKHLEFKILHPYCAPDESTFCSWNIGKQRACEWLRAKTARSLLKDAGYDLHNVWTTREVLLWARFHGYTPGLPVEDNQQSGSPSSCDHCDNPVSSICEFGEMTAVGEWLDSKETTSSTSTSLSHLPEIVPPSDESDEDIDVDSISTTDSPSKAKVKQEPSSIRGGEVHDEIPLEVPLHPIGQMVTKALKSTGLHLSSEEVVPGVYYPAAHRMLIQAVQSFAEDLTRRAFADAWGKDISRRPRSVEVSNVCSAICHRQEFDIFTCAGLGIKAICDSIISSKEFKNS